MDFASAVSRAARNWLAIVIIGLLGSLAAVAYTVFDSAKYEAKMTLFFPAHASTILGPVTITEGQTPTSPLATGPTPLKISRAFLESDRTLDLLVDATGLKRRKLEEVRKIADDAGSNTLTVAVQLPDKGLAKKILEISLASLRQINDDLAVHGLDNDESSLKSELSAQKKHLAELETKLKDFQRRAATAPTVSSSQSSSLVTASSPLGRELVEVRLKLLAANAKLQSALNRYQDLVRHRVVPPSDLTPVAEMRPNLVKAQYQLSLLLHSLGPDAPEVRRQKEIVNTLHDQLESELKAYYASAVKGTFDPTAQTKQAGDLSSAILDKVSLSAEAEALAKLAALEPEENREYLRLTREVSLTSEIVRQVSLHYQEAKLQASRDPNKWLLLDSPHVGDEPVNKKYLLMGSFGLLAGLFLGLLWAVNFGKGD